MITFCFNPSSKRESLKEFNDRLQEFCLDDGAITIKSYAVGKYVCLAVTTVEDLKVDDVMEDDNGEVIPFPTIMPVVLGLSSEDGNWEEQIELLIEREKKKAAVDDDQRDLTDVMFLQNGHDPSKAWLIVFFTTGEIDPPEFKEEGDDEGGDDEGGDEGPTQPINVGFVPTLSE